MIKTMLTVVALATTGVAAAKLPPPDDAAKAAAAKAGAQAAWQAKADAYQLCKVQDRLASQYKASHPDAKATVTAPTASAGAASASAASAAAPSTTPVAAASPNAPAPAGCADPGPFAYAPPDQKPLETSEAHSPAANATSPPSVRAESATMTDGKTGAARK